MAKSAAITCLQYLRKLPLKLTELSGGSFLSPNAEAIAGFPVYLSTMQNRDRSQTISPNSESLPAFLGLYSASLRILFPVLSLPPAQHLPEH